MEEKCKKCILENKNTLELIEEYEEKLKNKPTTMQIVALAFSCFAIGLSLAKLFVK